MIENKVIDPADFFEYAQACSIDLERTLDRIQNTQEMLEMSGISYENVIKKRASGEGIDKYVSELIDYMDELKSQQSNYIEVSRLTEYVIERINNPYQRQAVGLRYIHGLSYSKIGDKIGYSKQGARKLIMNCFDNMKDWLPRAIQEYRDNPSLT